MFCLLSTVLPCIYYLPSYFLHSSSVHSAHHPTFCTSSLHISLILIPSALLPCTYWSFSYSLDSFPSHTAHCHTPTIIQFALLLCTYCLPSYLRGSTDFTIRNLSMSYSLAIARKVSQATFLYLDPINFFFHKIFIEVKNRKMLQFEHPVHHTKGFVNYKCLSDHVIYQREKQNSKQPGNHINIFSI